MAGPTGGGPTRGPKAVGRALRECREAFGRSLEEVAESTNIRLGYLEALEEGEYGAFPGEFWARLFLKSYAQQLGLPPDETIARAFGEDPAGEGLSGRARREPLVLDDEPPPRPPATTGYEPRLRGRGRADGAGRRPDEGSRRSVERLSELGPRAARRQWASPVLAIVAAVIVAGLLGGIIYNFVRLGPREATPPARPTTSTGTGGGGTKTAGSGKSATPPKSGSSGPAKSPTKGAGTTAASGYTTVLVDAHALRTTYRVASPPIRLELTFSRRCWVGITKVDSGSVAVEGIYRAGSTLRYQSATAIVVDVGAPTAARGTLNGKAVGPWPGSGPWYLNVEP